VAIASQFRSTGDVFQRLVDIHAWPSVKYWSITRQAWLPLALSVSPLVAESRQQDSPLASNAMAGERYQFTERDENGGDIVYRLRVVRHDREHLAVATENVTPIRIAIFMAFEPGSLQTATFVQRIAAEQWRTYQVTRVGGGGSSLVLRQSGSYVNRLEAVRRYLAGVAEDQLPPLAAH